MRQLLFIYSLLYALLSYGQSKGQRFEIYKVEVNKNSFCLTEGDTILKFDISFYNDRGKTGTILCAIIGDTIDIESIKTTEKEGTITKEISLLKLNMKKTKDSITFWIDEPKENKEHKFGTKTYIEVYTRIIITGKEKYYKKINEKDSSNLEFVSCSEIFNEFNLSFDVDNTKGDANHDIEILIRDPNGNEIIRKTVKGAIVHNINERYPITKDKNGEYTITVTNKNTGCLYKGSLKVELGKKNELEMVAIGAGKNGDDKPKSNAGNFLLCKKNPTIFYTQLKNKHFKKLQRIYWFKIDTSLDEVKNIDAISRLTDSINKLNYLDKEVEKHQNYLGYWTATANRGSNIVKNNNHILIKNNVIDIIDEADNNDSIQGGLKVMQYDSSYKYFCIAVDLEYPNSQRLCVVNDNFIVRYANFDNIKHLMCKLEGGDLSSTCGSRQKYVIRRMGYNCDKDNPIVQPKADKYGVIVNYLYQQILVNPYLIKDKFGVDVEFANIVKLDVDFKPIIFDTKELFCAKSWTDTTFYPFFSNLRVEVEGETCDCEYNVDPVSITDFINSTLNLNTATDRKGDTLRRKAFRNPKFISTYLKPKKDTAADNLYLPLAVYPHPKIAFYIVDDKGKDIRRLGENDATWTTYTCAAKRADTVFNYTLCDKVNIRIKREGIAQLVKAPMNVDSDGDTIVLKDEQGVKIRPVKGVYSLENSGIYTVYTISDAGCFINEDNKIIIKSKRESITAWYDENICIGDTINIYAKGGQEYYIIKPYNREPDIKPLVIEVSDTVKWKLPYHLVGNSQKITIESKSNSGCIITKEIYLNLNSATELYVEPKLVSINYGQAVRFEAKGATKYFWRHMDDMDTLSKTDVLDFIPTKSGKYIVYGYNEKNCMDSMIVTLKIINDPSNDTEEGKDFEQDFEIEGSQASSPIIGIDDKGNESHFIIAEKYAGKPYYALIILNRWGDVVYSVKNYTNGDFKGKTSGGKCLPDGTYYYQIVREGNSKPDKKGFITVRCR